MHTILSILKSSPHNYYSLRCVPWSHFTLSRALKLGYVIRTGNLYHITPEGIAYLNGDKPIDPPSFDIVPNYDINSLIEF